jgi:hypothetical protein
MHRMDGSSQRQENQQQKRQTPSLSLPFKEEKQGLFSCEPDRSWVYEERGWASG